MLEEYYGGEALVHGGWRYERWAGSAALVVSDFGEVGPDGVPLRRTTRCAGDCRLVTGRGAHLEVSMHSKKNAKKCKKCPKKCRKKEGENVKTPTSRRHCSLVRGGGGK